MKTILETKQSIIAYQNSQKLVDTQYAYSTTQRSLKHEGSITFTSH